MNWNWFWIIVAAVILFLIFAGCHKSIESGIAETLTTDKAKTEAIITISEMKERMKRARATDILRFIFILAMAAGLYAWIRGNAGGTAVIIAGGGGLMAVQLDQKLAEIPALYVIGVAAIFVGFLLFLYRDRIGKSAFKNYIKGNHLIKPEQKLVDKVNGKGKK